MKILNEELLDLLKSLEKEEVPKEIGLDDFAPDPNTNIIDYDSSKDPEKLTEAKKIEPSLPEEEIYKNSHSNEAPSDALAAIMGTDATEIANDADFIFKDMENIVKSVVLGHADKRHALIAGDPGVGKCHHKDELITIHVPDAF